MRSKWFVKKTYLLFLHEISCPVRNYRLRHPMSGTKESQTYDLATGNHRVTTTNSLSCDLKVAVIWLQSNSDQGGRNAVRWECWGADKTLSTNYPDSVERRFCVWWAPTVALQTLWCRWGPSSDSRIGTWRYLARTVIGTYSFFRLKTRERLLCVDGSWNWDIDRG